MIPFVTISEVCEVIAGQSPPSDTYNQDKIGVPFFQGKADFGVLNPRVRYWCSKPTKISKPNDILFSVRAPVGPTNINNIEACIGRGLSAIRCGEKIDLKYLLHYLRANENKIAALGTGSTFKAITIKTLKEIQIPLPPIQVQQKIAAILDAADELRQKDKALVAKYDELTQALFLDMFGNPVKNPMGWNMKYLGSLSRRIVVGHVGPTSSGYAELGIPFLRTQNVRPNFINYKDLAHITVEFHNKLKKSQIFANDVLISRVGVNRGMAAVVPDNLNEANCANVVIVGNTELLNSYYLSFFLNMSFGRKPEYGYSVGSAQGVVNTSIVKRWPIFNTPIILQNQFAERVKAIEEQKSIAKASALKSEELFNSLLQKAFNGELV
jgi:type I restriction enzyme S subunit